MREIKLKRIDNNIIVVADSIMFRTFDSNEVDDMYNEISDMIERINSGLLDDDESRNLKSELLQIMVPKKKMNYMRSESAKEESYKLADGDSDIKSRSSIMLSASKVSDRFEYRSGYCYLKGYETPIPYDLATALIDAHENENSNYTVDSLINFWQWALLNPNEEARNDLFAWFRTGGFTITESGNIVAYRCVAIKGRTNVKDVILRDFVQSEYMRVKRNKKSPKNYNVILRDRSYKVVGVGVNMKDSDKYIGNLYEMNESIEENDEGDIYTDNHTRTFTIKIGDEVRMPREDCDENREAQCSRGLHFMSKKYNLRLGEEKLVILINPMNVVAFPSYDQSKGRCCAYLPIGKAILDENGDIEEFNPGSYDLFYSFYTKDILDQMLRDYDLTELQEDGKLAVNLTINELHSIRDDIAQRLSKKVVYEWE